MRRAVLVFLFGLLAAACGDDAALQGEPADDRFPSVVGATARPGGDGSWTISAAIRSPYDSPERYADAWRVLGPDGEVFGVRELSHDHAAEQPFTRSLASVDIPPDVVSVTIEGRDLHNGWGGEAFTFTLGD